MKNSLHSLHHELRWTQASLALTVAALLCAATPAVRPLFLAAGTNQPTTPINLSGPNVTGDPTSGKAINPASVVAGGAALNEYGTTIALIYLHSRQAVFRGPSNFLFSWTPGNGYAAPDIGFSRVAPGGLALGNGTPGDTSGSLTLGNLTASGYLSFDGGAGYSDGLGTLTVAGLRSADDSLILNDNGLVINRMTIADNAGQLWIGGFYLIGDSDGYLNTGSQSYTAGAVTPTGFLVLKDGNGVRYRIPAAAAP